MMLANYNDERQFKTAKNFALKMCLSNGFWEKREVMSTCLCYHDLFALWTYEWVSKHSIAYTVFFGSYNSLFIASKDQLGYGSICVI